jgi:N6-adenosine-specific RNA methylase IME4
MPFPGMTLEDIRRLPVAEFAEPDCRLFLWTTNAYLGQSFGVLEAWGFRYSQTLVWHKTNPSPWPTSVAPNSAEFILVGSAGSPERLTPWSAAVVPYAVPKGHSRKPEAFLDLIEQVSPGPYLELFARRQRLGWDTWGNEALEHVELAT